MRLDVQLHHQWLAALDVHLVLQHMVGSHTFIETHTVEKEEIRITQITGGLSVDASLAEWLDMYKQTIGIQYRDTALLPKPKQAHPL